MSTEPTPHDAHRQDGQAAMARTPLDPSSPEDGELDTPGSPDWIGRAMQIARSRVVRIAFLLLVVALLAAALVDQGGTLWREVQRLSPPVVLLALGTNVCGLIFSLLVWRSLLADLGSPLPLRDAWQIFFVGQLAKYIPGSVWPMIAQTELGADRGIPRGSSAVSVILSYGVTTATGGLVAAVSLPIVSSGSLAHYFWIPIVVALALLLLSPPVLNRVLGRLLRLLRRRPLERHVTRKGISRTIALALLGWLVNGATVYVLLRQLAGHDKSLVPLAIGAYALSWVVGFLAIFAPAGAGVREAVIVATLSTKTTAAIALTIALLIRALSVVSDGINATAAAALLGHDRLQRLRRTDARSPQRASEDS